MTAQFCGLGTVEAHALAVGAPVPGMGTLPLKVGEGSLTQVVDWWLARGAGRGQEYTLGRDQVHASLEGGLHFAGGVLVIPELSDPVLRHERRLTQALEERGTPLGRGATHLPV